jgi:hypothetical protein
MAALQNATVVGVRFVDDDRNFPDIANPGGGAMSVGRGCEWPQFVNTRFTSPVICLVEKQHPVLTKRKLSANDALDGSGWKSI